MSKTIDIQSLPSLAFNTKRCYTEKGQRIGCVAIDGGVFMNDIDRGIRYFFPACALSQSEIMRRYDAGQYPEIWYAPSIKENNYEQQNEISDFTRNLALGCDKPVISNDKESK